LLALQGWNGINQCEGLLRIVTIGTRELDGERNTTTIANQMTLAAELRSVAWGFVTAANRAFGRGH
jgi:hypothetical protein